MAEQLKPRDLSIGTFSDEQLGRVLNGFGVESFVVLPFFSLNDEIIDLRRRTTTSRKVLIEHGGAVSFLKELPWYCSSLDFARFQSVFQNELRGRGLPVPPLVESATKDLFHHDGLTGGIFLLQEYVAGRGWSQRPEEAHSAGQVLGRMHRAGVGPQLPVVAGMRGVFESAAALNSLLFEGMPGPEQVRTREYARHADDVIRQCRERAHALGYGETVVPVHGDFSPYNLVFAEHGDEIAGVIDFDNACLDHPAHDLGEAIVRFAWMNFKGLSSAYAQVPETFAGRQITALLDGYRSTAGPHADGVLPVLPEAITVIAIELAAIGLLSSDYGPAELPLLRRNLDLLPALAREAVATAC